MYTMSSMLSNLLAVSCAEDDWGVCSKHRGRGFLGEPPPRWFNIQQLYNWTASVAHKRLQTLADRAGAGGFVVLASRWRSGVHLPGWTAAWWCGGGFNFVWSEWNAAWSLTFWSRELKILMVPCYTKFTSQVVSHHNACSSASSPKLKSRGLLLLTYSTVEDVCARKRTSTSQYQICKCKAESLLVGRL